MRDLEKMFKPDSVGVIGASNTPDKVGHIVVSNRRWLQRRNLPNQS